MTLGPTIFRGCMGRYPRSRPARCGATAISVAALPFGGFKQSGTGRAVLDMYTETESVLMPS